MTQASPITKWLIGLALALPWLNPFAPGPSPGMGPWFFSAACTLAAWGLVLPRRSAKGMFTALAALALTVLLASGAVSPELLLTPAALTVIALSAQTGCALAARPQFLVVMATAWLIAAALSCIIGLFQYFGAAQLLSPLVNISTEAFANLRQRNQFATLTAIGLTGLLWLTSRGLTFAQGVPLAVLLALGSAASASRIGAVQWIAILGLLYLWRSPATRTASLLALVGAVSYVAATVLLPLLSHWLTGIPGNGLLSRLSVDLGCSSRKVLWLNVVELIAQRPILGWGWGELDFAHFSHRYEGERFCDILDNAHNLPLHLAVEIGALPAGVLCLAGLWAIARSAPWREQQPQRQLAWGVLAVILLHSMVEYPLWYGPFQMAFGLVLGLLWPGQLVANGCADETAVARVSGYGFARAAVAGVLAGMLAFAVWDYQRVSEVYRPVEARSEYYRDNTMEKIQGSRLFVKQVQFAQLITTPLTSGNAQWTFDLASALLHYSPEPRVIEKLIESATYLGRDTEAVIFLDRFKAAFPSEYAAWRAANIAPR